MKKFSYSLLMIFTVAAAIVFSGCGASKSKAEKRFIEQGKFVGNKSYVYKDSTLSVNADKTYSMYIYNHETAAYDYYEGTWSYVLTYKYKYTYNWGPFDIFPATEHTSFDVFKLDGYIYRDKQGYFVWWKYRGLICNTNEDFKSYIEQHKEENGSIALIGFEMETAPKD